jgi:uncharacterized protein YpmB
MDSTILLMSLLGIGVIIFGVKIFKDSSIKVEKVESSTPKRPKKSVKLFTRDGVLLYEYKDVYLTHWDKNIYYLSSENKGENFLRIDKGTDMLLLAENYCP